MNLFDCAYHLNYEEEEKQEKEDIVPIIVFTNIVMRDTEKISVSMASQKTLSNVSL